MYNFLSYETPPMLQLNNIRKLCRGCMADKGASMQPLFKAQISDMFTNVTAIQVSEDDCLPGLLCLNCVHSVTTMYSFKKQCEQTDTMLKQYITPQTLKYKQEESLQEQCSRTINKTDGLIYPVTSSTVVCQPSRTNNIFGELDFIRGITQDPLQADPQGDLLPISDVPSVHLFTMQNMDTTKLPLFKQTESTDLEHSNLAQTLDERINNSITNTINKNMKQPSTSGSDELIQVEPGSNVPCLNSNLKVITRTKSEIKCNLEMDEHECGVCNKCFKSAEGLKKHMKKHKGVLRLPCGICSEILAEETSLKVHLKVHKESGVFGCQMCSEVFNDWGKLHAHRFSHLKQQLEGDKNILYCQTCSKAFRNLDRLEAHLRIHVGKKPEVCKICGMDFNDLRCLKRHMLKHNAIKKYSCCECGKRFTYCNSLTQHIKIHRNIRKYVCDLCGKAFVQSNGLTSHMQSHSSETPFTCEICGRKLKSSESLKSHLLRHSGIKKFVCNICGKAFSTSSERITHLRTHTGEKPYSCRSCPKSFLTQSHLTVHVRSHTGQRPFQCDLCPSKFATSQVLKKHRMTHTGEKPHICVVCQRGFTQKNVLKTHMKTHQQLLQRVY